MKLYTSLCLAVLVGATTAAKAQEAPDGVTASEETAEAPVAAAPAEAKPVEEVAPPASVAPAPAETERTQQEAPVDDLSLPENNRGIRLKAETSAWSVGGYGEAVFSNRYYGYDTNEDYKGFGYNDPVVDLARVVFFVGYKFSDYISFNSEIELEHGGTGATMEYEWDEAGEFEVEIEAGGEVVLEQAYLEIALGDWLQLPLKLNLRIGHILVPMGMSSYYHLPTMIPATSRPESEAAIIPVTWHEDGIELATSYKRFRLQLQLVPGLNSAGFSTASFVAGGMQTAFETVRARDWGVAARLQYTGLRGLLLGTSVFTSNTTKNRPKRDLEDYNGRVILADIHARYRNGPLRVNALGIYGWLDDSAIISLRNLSLARALNVPRTTVAKEAYAAYIEASLDVLRLILPGTRHRIDVFTRVEAYDSVAASAVSGADAPRYERRTLTVGLNYFPHPRVVFKAEFLNRWLNVDNDWARNQEELNFGMGFVL